MRSAVLSAALVAIVIAIPARPSLAQSMRDVNIRTTKVAEGIYMLEGRGGNLGLTIGEDGAFLIDDQYAPLTGKITEAVEKLTEKPIRFVLNTHWHGDHTGGNENLGKAGAVIVAHENVRERMSVDQFMEAFNNTVPAAPPKALPVITFSDSVTFHWNGDALHAIHVPAAHTDGDTIVHFRQANVLHLGDTYFNGMYPFIDVASGGAIDGVIAAADLALSLADEDTRIIPGHGPLSGIDELREYRAMLGTVRDRVGELIRQGKSRDEVVAAKPTASLDAKWGGGFMRPDQFTGFVFDGMTRSD
ncbi:MAG: MBL fold metallo-hydrolase [Planctomycetota bacterium]|jgi:glyoxylase-like metal-dependent hydrolase (beta-lactamase superfamily II)